jgi:hypothetical protein
MTSGATETTPIVHDGVPFIFNYADRIQALKDERQLEIAFPIRTR